jgi:hypothetical protein
MVTMLRSRPERPTAEETSLSGLTCGLAWSAFVLDVVVAGYLIRSPEARSPLLSVITLGGHPRIVFGLAVAGLLLLAVLAPWTHGFVRADPRQRVLLPIAGVLSLSALAGLLAVLVLAAGAVVVVVLLFRPSPRARIDLIQRRR